MKSSKIGNKYLLRISLHTLGVLINLSKNLWEGTETQRSEKRSWDMDPKLSSML